MADPAAFSACLTRLGFNEPTRDFIIAQGISTAPELASLPYSELDDFVKHVIRNRPTHPPAIAGAAVLPTVNLPYLAVRKLKAFRLWIDYRQLRGQEFPPAAFDANTNTRWLGRVGELQQLIESDKAESPTMPPVFTSFSKWPEWEELFLTYLSHS